MLTLGAWPALRRAAAKRAADLRAAGVTDDGTFQALAMPRRHDARTIREAREDLLLALGAIR